VDMWITAYRSAQARGTEKRGAHEERRAGQLIGIMKFAVIASAAKTSIP